MPATSTDTTLKILVIDPHTIRRAVLESGLRDAGFSQVTVLGETKGLVEQIYRLDPDVILMDFENPSRDTLEQMFQVSRVVRRPIAMFVDKSDTPTIEAAIDAGVSAYIVDGLKRERVKPIIDMTISRFRAFEKLRTELKETKSALNERKVVEKAKGILMKSRGIGEEEAYSLLRKTAMNQSRRIADIAANLVDAASLMGNSDDPRGPV